MLKLLLSASSLTLIFGCGSGSSGIDNPERNLGRKIQHTSESSDFGKLIAEKTELRCGDDSCPEAVVSIYTATKKERKYTGYSFDIQQCSGTVISNDTILTNFHCIEDYLGYAVSSCDENVFIQTQNGDLHGCKEIISHSEFSLGKPKHEVLSRDVALIRLSVPMTLDSSEIPKVSVGQSFRLGEMYHAHVVNFGDNLSSGADIKRRDCLSIADNDVYPFDSKNNEVFQFFGNCDIIDGNSGSAIFNQKNEITGVFFARSDFPKVKESLTKVFSGSGIKFAKGAFLGKSTGLGVSFTCLNSPLIEGIVWNEENPKCESSFDSDSRYKNKQTNIHKVIDRIIEHSKSSKDEIITSEFFEYDILRQGNLTYLSPTCFKAEKFSEENSEMPEDLSGLNDKLKSYTLDVVLDLDKENYRYKVLKEKSTFSAKSEDFYLISKSLDYLSNKSEKSARDTVIRDCE